jgi:hypothetical protein
MGSKRLRPEDKAAMELRDLIAGIRPVGSTAERIQLRSRQLQEELPALRDTAAPTPRPKRSGP